MHHSVKYYRYTAAVELLLSHPPQNDLMNNGSGTHFLFASCRDTYHLLRHRDLLKHSCRSCAALCMGAGETCQLKSFVYGRVSKDNGRVDSLEDKISFESFHLRLRPRIQSYQKLKTTACEVCLRAQTFPTAFF